MLRIKAISIICLLFLATLVFTSFGGPQTGTGANAKDAQGDNEQGERTRDRQTKVGDDGAGGNEVARE
jgi:hypothetical protein